jgi:hypothetical protein
MVNCSFSGVINWSEPLISALSCIEGEIKYIPDLWGVREKVEIPTRMNGYIGNIHKAKKRIPELVKKEFTTLKNIIDKEYFEGLAELILKYYQKNKYKERLPLNRESRYSFHNHMPKKINVKSLEIIRNDEMDLICSIVDTSASQYIL